MNTMQISLTAGILIFGVVLFRLFFAHRLPARIMVLLWEIAVLRLLIPFSLPSPLPGIGKLVTEYTQPAGMVTVTSTELTLGETEGEAVYYDVQIQDGFRWDMIYIIYLAGTAVMILGSAYLYMRDSRIFRESLPMAESEKSRLIRQMTADEKEWEQLEKVRFRISDRTVTPVTYGMFRQAIVFPRNIFFKGEKEAAFCLSHELVHIRRHDNLRKLIIHAALCVHWFNPLVWVMYILANRDLEIYCDEMAVRFCQARRQDYALTLLSMAERRVTGFRTVPGFGKNAVKERIQAVMTVKKPGIAGTLIMTVAAAVAFTVFLTDQVLAFSVVTGTVRSAETTDQASETVAVATYEAEEEAVYEATITVTADAVDTVHVTNDAADLADRGMEYWIVSTGSIAEDQTVAGVVMEEAEVQDADAVWEESEDTMSSGLTISVRLLEEEFEEYGLSVEVGSSDYQIYYKGEPVYFFADNRSQDGEGFSGRVYARAAGGGNGDKGVITQRGEEGEITGLRLLSRTESKDFARVWTGKA